MYRKAAEQGNATAQYNLGRKLALGEGIIEDSVMAYAWLNIAGANGISFARDAKSIIAKRMTKEQVAEAQKLSRNLYDEIEKRKSGSAIEDHSGATQQDDGILRLRSKDISRSAKAGGAESSKNSQERYELRGHQGWAMMKLGDKIGGLKAIELLASKGVTYLTSSEGLALLRKHGIATEYWAGARARLHCQRHSDWLDEETRQILEVQRKAAKRKSKGK